MRHNPRNLYNFFRYDIHQGIAALIYFFPVIWRFRRWDYSFQLAVIKRMLQNCDKHWHKSHYVGMEFTHGRIKVLLRMLDRYDNYWGDGFIKGVSSFQGEHDLLTLFLKRYSRTLPHLWD